MSCLKSNLFLAYTGPCYATLYMIISEHIVNIWSNLVGSVNFSSLTSFVCTVKFADLSNYPIFFRNEFYTSVGYQCLQSYVVYLFLGANVRAHCAFFVLLICLIIICC